MLKGNAVPLLKMPCSKPFSSRTTSLSSPMCTEFTVVQSSSEEEPSSPPPALNVKKLLVFIEKIKYNG